MEEEKKDQSFEKMELGEAIKRRKEGAEDDSD
jgi:hypothetical protein